MSAKKIGVIGVQDGWSSEQLAKAVAERTGQRSLIEMDQLAFDLTTGTVCHHADDLTTYDALIVKKIGGAYSPELMDRMEILRFLSHTGVQIFSDPTSMLGVVDRMSCTVSLRIAGIPIPPTVITENIDEGIKAVRRYGRAVLKPLFTTKARGMILVDQDDNICDRLRTFKEEGNPLLYIQQLVTLPGRDLGLVFLGGKYLKTYARVNNGRSWNTTIRAGGRYEPFEPAQELIDLASRAQSVFNLDFTCVDVAETPDGPVVFEVSAFGGFRGLQEAHGMNAAEYYTDYVIEQVTQ